MKRLSWFALAFAAVLIAAPMSASAFFFGFGFSFGSSGWWHPGYSGYGYPGYWGYSYYGYRPYHLGGYGYRPYLHPYSAYAYAPPLPSVLSTPETPEK